MKPRNNPTDEQSLRRLQREPIGPKNPRTRNDAYWALRHQGYSHEYAKRACRDTLPRFYKERVELSDDYLNDIEPEDLLFVPQVATEVQKLAVIVRPDLIEDVVSGAPSRSTEYTIWSESPPGFGLRVRPSGSRSFIVMFRIAGTGQQGKLTLGKAGTLSLERARLLAREARVQAMAGNDPRPMHKTGKLLKLVQQ